MTFRLSIQNLPPSLTVDEFREKFKDYKGLVNSRVFFNDRNEAVYGELDFTTFECADYCKKSSNGFRFPGQHSGIITDYSKQENFTDYAQQQQILDPQLQQNIQPGIAQNLNQGIVPNMGIPQVNLPQKDEYYTGNYQHLNYQGNFNQLNQHQQQQDYSQFRQTQQQQNQQQQPNQQFQKFANHNMNNPPPSIQQPLHGQFVQQPIPNPVMGHQFQHSPANIIAQVLQQNQVMPPPMGPISQSMMRDPFTQNPSDVALFKISQEATNSLYVDGIPIDSNEREVAHIFRPFPGFQTVRLIKKTSQTGREFFYCFVDFENPLQSTIALVTLQGYRFSKLDQKGLKISYANEPHENKDFRKKNLRKK